MLSARPLSAELGEQVGWVISMMRVCLVLSSTCWLPSGMYIGCQKFGVSGPGISSAWHERGRGWRRGCKWRPPVNEHDGRNGQAGQAGSRTPSKGVSEGMSTCCYVCTFTTLDFSMYRITSYIWRICHERHMAGLNLADFWVPCTDDVTKWLPYTWHEPTCIWFSFLNRRHYFDIW